MKMLIADDIEINREIIISLLEHTGLAIDSAENGKEALNMVESAADKYDIIFMDLQMPIMDGLEATRQIRAFLEKREQPSQGRRRLPIIAMTANAFKDDINNCIEAGMDGHLSKPLDVDRIFEVLCDYLLEQ